MLCLVGSRGMEGGGGYRLHSRCSLSYLRSSAQVRRLWYCADEFSAVRDFVLFFCQDGATSERLVVLSI